MILLVGYGYWGKNLARNFSKELTAVCDSDVKKLEIAKSLYPAITTYTSLEAALEHSGIKAVVIATKANTHYNIALQALAKGKDLWIEKPACETLDQINNLIKESEKTKNIIFVDHTFCYNPAVEQLKHIDIGKPIYYDSTRISLGLFQSDVDALLDLAIHDLSIVNYLYPDLELQDRTIIKNNHINDKANQVIVNLKFTNGFTTTTNCNWVSPVKKRQIILTGDKNSVVYDDIDLDKIKIYSTGEINPDFNANQLGDMLAPKVVTTEALYTGRTHFLKCIESRSQPLTSIYTAKKIMGWVL
jgi:predicted dehydrogenase